MAFERGGPGVRALNRITVVMGANADVVDTNVFIADKPYELIGVQEVHNVLGTDAGAVTLDVKKCTGTTAVASGTTILATTFDLKATINTVVKKTLSNGGLSATAASRFLAAGDRVVIDITGVTTAVAGLAVLITLRPTGPKSSQY